MALSREGSSFWSRLRPRPSVDPPSSLTPRPVLPMDTWNLLDELTRVPPAQGSTSRSTGSYIYEVHDIHRFFVDWVRLSNNRSRQREQMHQERIDTAAVLRKCQKVVYKPTSCLWGKAKVDADQFECPVCLENLVAKDKLFMLPCKHQFHVDCLTPWIRRNHACCPCCRADIRRGPTKDEKTSVSINDRSSIVSYRPWRNSRDYDRRMDNAMSGQSSSRGRELRNESVTGAQNNGRISNSGEEDADAWEGLHEYIMAALAEVDAELNRFMR